MKLQVVSEKPKIEEDWTISQIVENYTPYTWETVFNDSCNEFADIDELLSADRGKLLPSNKNIFRAFQLTPLPKVKVVIIGQDPYHSLTSDGTPLATGLSFSIPKGVQIPSSLQNIYKELQKSVSGFQTPSHGDLTSWAVQGVLMLNSCLTVRKGEPGCHKEIWFGFIKRVIKAVLNHNPNCIFVAWGKNAQKVAKKFVGENGHTLVAAHPSGLSAHRGFFGCNHFNQINDILKESGKPLIDWNLY